MVWALVTIIGIGLFILAIYQMHTVPQQCHRTLFFQILMLFGLDICMGYIYMLYTQHRQKEKELQQLRIDTLQNRCNALTSQVSPHFFFNSLNSISCLVRKHDDENTLSYIDHLSDIFRYTLQSEHKGLVCLTEELEFLQNFRNVMEVRYANKLSFDIHIPEAYCSRQIPVLTLLPLLENITVHNIIDSEHLMRVNIYVDDHQQLVVENTRYEKPFKEETHGTGLKNLQNRYLLLMDKEIRVENTDKLFKVYLPL